MKIQVLLIKNGGGGWSNALASAPASGPHRFKFFKQVLYVLLDDYCLIVISSSKSNDASEHT